jgi:predicted dehydrogenase
LTADGLKVGMIGAGGISSVHAAGWAALGASVRVFAHEGAEELATRHDVTVAPSLEELLRSVDVVDIVTPSATHRPIALAAIAAGKNVICEKPLGANLADVQEILSAARAAGVRVFPAHVVRYFPEYAVIRDQIVGGTIGRVGILRFTRTGEAPRGKQWFYDEHAGGGLVRDLMIHDLDQAAWMAGDVVEVFGQQNPRSVDGISTAPVVAQAVLTHASGALSHLEARWGAPGTAFRTTVAVFGDSGMLKHDSATNLTSVIDDASGAGDDGYVPVATDGESPYETELRDFADAIEEGRDARATEADGAVAVGLAMAVLQSIQSGEPVSFDAELVRASVDSASEVGK